MYLVCSLDKYCRRQIGAMGARHLMPVSTRVLGLDDQGIGKDKAPMQGPGERRAFIYCAISRISSIKCAKFTTTPLVGQIKGALHVAIQ
jgi:hypothetical protein